ncbi:MAG: M28 family peptidase [Moraxellaceae bacterium]|nr:M28 family peptidase [Pseudobdellovibrionaceae bacterium]
MNFKIFILSLCFLSNAWSHSGETVSQTVLTDLSSAKAVNGIILAQDELLNIAVTRLTADQVNKISEYSHTQNKCAGFEVLNAEEAAQPEKIVTNLKTVQQNMYVLSPMALGNQVTYDANYAKLAAQADPLVLQSTIAWLSSYPNRWHKSKTPDQHVDDLQIKLYAWLKDAPWKYTIEKISHTSTRQSTLKLTITGAVRPNEIVVLGAHLDSINQSAEFPFIGSAAAPGADDNASGSSNLIETLKILKQVNSFERTLEFYWYAGEEGGLLGSAEVARTAKSKNENIIGVLQLDMTLFPGDGEQVISLMDDFTSPWLNTFITEINDVYVKARVIHSKCGYACSDHASWNKQGYHAAIPFESSMANMNPKIHSAKDIINPQSSFTHSSSFTKLATLFALTLGNSSIKAP